MDEQRARALLDDERRRIDSLLAHLGRDRAVEQFEATSLGDATDAAQPLISEQENDAIAAALRLRLAAVERAEARLAAGTYGRSVRSGEVIPDERLLADPTAELTVDEAAQA